MFFIWQFSANNVRFFWSPGPLPAPSGYPSIIQCFLWVHPVFHPPELDVDKLGIVQHISHVSRVIAWVSNSWSTWENPALFHQSMFLIVLQSPLLYNYMKKALSACTNQSSWWIIQFTPFKQFACLSIAVTIMANQTWFRRWWAALFALRSHSASTALGQIKQQELINQQSQEN